MALTGWSVTDYLSTTDEVWPGGAPFLVSIWAWKDDPGANLAAFALGQASSADPRRSLVHNIGSPSQLNVQSRQAPPNDAARVDDEADQSWEHYAGTYVSSTLREAWVNGANKATNTTDITPGAPDSTYIGVLPNISLPWQNTGALAEVSVWDLAGFTEQDRDDLVAELADARDPLEINQDGGQVWTDALVDLGGGNLAYASLLTTGDLGPFTMTGTLTEFGSHPPIGIQAPAAPTLVAEATSWDATLLTTTDNGGADSITVYRSTMSPVDPQSDPIAAAFTPDGQEFDTDRSPNTQYFYLAVASNAQGTTDGTEQDVTTWSDDAIETFLDNDSIQIPFDVPNGERATEVRLKAGTALRSLAVLVTQGDLAVEVRDESGTLVGSNDFTDLPNDPDPELDKLVVFLSPPPVGPQTITATYTASIT